MIFFSFLNYLLFAYPVLFSLKKYTKAKEDTFSTENYLAGLGSAQLHYYQGFLVLDIDTVTIITMTDYTITSY